MSGGEFARIAKLDRLPTGAMEIEATDAELRALARRFGLPALERLKALIVLKPEGDRIGASGRIAAAFTQRCAVTDEPFANVLDEPFAVRFVPALTAASEEEEQEFASGEPDEVEYEGAALDIGEAVAQSFGLALDPYATGPDAERGRIEAGIADEAAPTGPFAALAALKRDP